MSIPILATKLYIPVPSHQVVQRQRLIQRLNESLDRKLTLISSSAGFGKTTLVSEWAAHCDRPVAWLSLDEGDVDSTRFLLHLVAALRKIEEHIGGGAVSALTFSQPPSIESILSILLNEIAAYPSKFVLVLDDFHIVDAGWIDEAVQFIIEHLPPQMHLVIATRENPQLPLARLRARGHLTELRDSDLRFTPDEATAFLNQGMGLNLSTDEMTALEKRTEGWIAGLQLAALSMKGRQDIPAFIREFAGDNRYIMDYLIEEVLQRQPESIRRFLLQTSILERLHGPLCDAVTGQRDGATLLQSLERGNFFVIPLDDKGQWYRYHHLFAEVLSAHLKSDRHDEAADLHRRASIWYEQHGSADDAVRHALAAEDFARAADLIERAIPSLRRSRQEAAMLKWLASLPDEWIGRRPVLSVWYAGALLAGGKLEAVENRLRDAERRLEQDPPTGMSIMDAEEYGRLPGMIAVYRSGLALVLNDVPAAMIYARQALDRMPADDDLLRGAATAILGLASWRNGNLELAHRMFADGITNVKLSGAISDAINGSIALAEIRIAQGRLREAMRTYERGLRQAVDHGEPDLRGTADIYVGMSELCREFDDLHSAARHLSRSKEQGEHTGFPLYPYRWHVAMARIRMSEGDFNGSLDHLHEAEQLDRGDFFLDARPASALKARVWIAQGSLGDAYDWVREQGVTAADELRYDREFEHVTLARVLLARYKNDRDDRLMNEAMGLLKRLLQAAEEGERTGSVIEILVVTALAHARYGDIPSALTLLERALTLAEAEGYVRIFADEGAPMADLLAAALKRGIAPNYVRRLLNSCGKTAGRSAGQQAARELSEPLSEREQEVLRLLGTDLSGPDIARELFVSLNTLRTHTKNIYDKLQVNNRRAAVRRAQELHLL